MNNVKQISLGFILVISGCMLAQGKSGIASNAGVNAMIQLDETVQKTLPAIQDVALKGTEVAESLAKSAKFLAESADQCVKSVKEGSENFGRNFGLGTVALLIKTGKLGVPYMPYVAGGIVAAYGGYQTYRYFYPTQKQIAYIKQCKIFAAEKELNECLLKHQTCKRNEVGVPVPCQSQACKLALFAGREKVDEKIAAFNKYAPLNIVV